MTTIANLKGGLLKTLIVSRTASSTSLTTLKDDFIKKAENYVCQIPQFIMNNATVLSLLTEVMFEVRIMGGARGRCNHVKFPCRVAG